MPFPAMISLLVKFILIWIISPAVFKNLIKKIDGCIIDIVEFRVIVLNCLQFSIKMSIIFYVLLFFDLIPILNVQCFFKQFLFQNVKWFMKERNCWCWVDLDILEEWLFVSYSEQCIAFFTINIYVNVFLTADVHNFLFSMVVSELHCSIFNMCLQ